MHNLYISNSHMYTAVSGMDSAAQIHTGRPFGEVPVIWNKRLNNCIRSIDTNSKIIYAVLFTLIITAYNMP